jgi:Phage integrase, N-terminal SAM-like domain
MNKANTYDYDAQVRAIRAYNQPILDDFRIWLEQSGLSEKTVKIQVDNINFFTNYLVYQEPLKKLNEAESADVWMFLANWFPHKAMWVSATSVKSNIASFKKFFQWSLDAIALVIREILPILPFWHTLMEIDELELCRLSIVRL